MGKAIVEKKKSRIWNQSKLCFSFEIIMPKKIKMSLTMYLLQNGWMGSKKWLTANKRVDEADQKVWKLQPKVPVGQILPLASILKWNHVILTQTIFLHEFRPSNVENQEAFSQQNDWNRWRRQNWQQPTIARWSVVTFWSLIYK